MLRVIFSFSAGPAEGTISSTFRSTQTKCHAPVKRRLAVMSRAARMVATACPHRCCGPPARERKMTWNCVQCAILRHFFSLRASRPRQPCQRAATASERTMLPSALKDPLALLTGYVRNEENGLGCLPVHQRNPSSFTFKLCLRMNSEIACKGDESIVEGGVGHECTNRTTLLRPISTHHVKTAN